MASTQHVCHALTTMQHTRAQRTRPAADARPLLRQNSLPPAAGARQSPELAQAQELHDAHTQVVVEAKQVGGSHRRWLCHIPHPGGKSQPHTWTSARCCCAHLSQTPPASRGRSSRPWPCLRIGLSSRAWHRVEAAAAPPWHVTAAPQRTAAFRRTAKVAQRTHCEPRHETVPIAVGRRAQHLVLRVDVSPVIQQQLGDD